MEKAVGSLGSQVAMVGQEDKEIRVLRMKYRDIVIPVGAGVTSHLCVLVGSR